VHLEAQVLDLMTGWIQRYRREAQERFTRLDAVLDELAATQTAPRTTPTRRPAGGTR
jgi:hypothetical protein